jgi:hypothetical protein
VNATDTILNNRLVRPAPRISAILDGYDNDVIRIRMCYSGILCFSIPGYSVRRLASYSESTVTRT